MRRLDSETNSAIVGGRCDIWPQGGRPSGCARAVDRACKSRERGALRRLRHVLVAGSAGGRDAGDQSVPQRGSDEPGVVAHVHQHPQRRAALQSIQDWLTEMSNPLSPQCRVSFEVDGATSRISATTSGSRATRRSARATRRMSSSSTARRFPRGAARSRPSTCCRTALSAGRRSGNRTFTVPAQPSAAFVGTWQR